MARAFSILRNGETVALPYGPFVDAEGTQHSVQVLEVWTEEALSTIAVTAEEVPDPVPAEVPMYKVKKYMALVKYQTEVDLHAAVIAYMEALPEPARTMALIDFGPAPDQIGSPNLVVNSTLALGAKAALSLTDEQYDDMIRAAAALA